MIVIGSGQRPFQKMFFFTYYGIKNFHVKLFLNSISRVENNFGKTSYMVSLHEITWVNFHLHGNEHFCGVYYALLRNYHRNGKICLYRKSVTCLGRAYLPRHILHEQS